MKAKKQGKKVIVPVVILCVTMAACSTGEKEHEEPVMLPVIKTDLTGDGEDDSVFVEEINESGEMKGIYATRQSESGEVSLEVPDRITISCAQESSTEFRISCDNLFLGTTTLAEKTAYGVLGTYLEETLEMKKSGDLYKIEVDCDTFSFIEAENHNGSAFSCKGQISVEEQLLPVEWTLEYSLGEWLVTSVELPLWSITGTTTGWETTRAEWSETTKKRRYVGYLDESSLYQDIKSVQDYDGDGINDRIWKEISADGESYTIHFGNGEELLITDDFNGNRFECYLWAMTEDTTVCWFQEAGMSTGGDWIKVYLFEQTKQGLKPMELPETPVLTAEAVSERKIAFYWEEHENVGSLFLDEISCFAELTAEEWLEEYTSEENGEYIFRLSGYDECFMMDGSVPEREAIQWHTSIGDKWGRATFAWVTEYIDEEWQMTSVFLR